MTTQDPFLREFRAFLREFRLFRDATLGRLSIIEVNIEKLTAAVGELGKTVESIPGLVDQAIKQDANARVLEARLRVVEEDHHSGNGKRKNGGSSR